MNTLQKNLSCISSFHLGAFLLVLSLCAYWGVQDHEFIELDDHPAITDNAHIQHGLSLSSIRWAFTTAYYDYWHPLPWLTHMIDWQPYGKNAGGHLLTNLILHMLNAVLLFAALTCMTGCKWRSALVAALFAVHPINVESVAWVVERKNVLSTLFWMLTMWSYILYSRSPNPLRYVGMLMIFITGLTAKPMLVTLPFVLLLIDFWPLKRLRAESRLQMSDDTPIKDRFPTQSLLQLVLEKVPLLVLAIACSYLIYAIVNSTNALYSWESFPLDQRIANALVSYVSYMGKLFWPAHLAVYYPLVKEIPFWKVASSAILIGAISAGAVRLFTRQPYVLIGWLWFLGTMLPVIGIIQTGSQSMADRFAYIPSIGLFIALVWGWADVAQRHRSGFTALSIMAIIVIASLLLVTRRQVGYWKNDITLFEHTLKVTSNNFLIHNNLGAALLNQGKKQEALAHFTKSVEINPGFSLALCNLGTVAGNDGDLGGAEKKFSEALRADPSSIRAHMGLALVNELRGNDSGAVDHYLRVIQIRNDYWQAYLRLGVVWCRAGDFDKAINPLRNAVRINPDAAEAYQYLGLIFMNTGDFISAESHFAKAAVLNPGDGQNLADLGFSLLNQKKLNTAIRAFAAAITVNPDSARPYLGRAIAYSLNDEPDPAISDLQKTISLQPDLADAHFYLGLAFKKKGVLDSAAAHFSQSAKLHNRKAGLAGPSGTDVLKR
jgi:tetratricopeptide (TPR) repeat protein